MLFYVSISVPISRILSFQLIESLSLVVSGRIASGIESIVEMSIQIEQLAVAIDRVLAKVDVDRRVLAGDGGDLDASECARVDLLQVVVRQAQPLEAVEVREGLGRDELQIVVGQIECSQVDVVLEVVLAESQSVARQVQVLKVKNIQ